MREVFVTLGKAGGCASSQLETTGRLISRFLGFMSHITPDKLIRDLRGNHCHQPGHEQGEKILSCSDAIGLVLERELEWEKTDEFKNIFNAVKQQEASEENEDGED